MKLIIGVVVVITAVATWYFIANQQSEKNLQEEIAISSDLLSTALMPETESSGTPFAPEKIDAHLVIDNTLRNVSFCGTSYQVKRITIDGVDVIQRFAEIVSHKAAVQADLLSKGICADFSSFPPSSDSFAVARYDAKWQAINDDTVVVPARYIVSINRFTNLIVNYPSLQIEISGDTEGGTAIFGNLK